MLLMRWGIPFMMVFCLLACNDGSVTATGGDNVMDLSAYTSESAAGGKTMVYKVNADGEYEELGFVKNGVKHGVWLTYHPKNIVKTMAHYIDGVQYGPFIEYSNRGQIEKQTQYKANKLHGKYAEYKFGRYVKRADYKDGVLEGDYVEYFKNTDKIQKLVQFKGGKQDGKMQYFDEDGNVTLEYTYKDGEKVGGGLDDQ